ncbi:nitrile hydratase subunit beta (plasmid) [Polymorphobacter sp. PAMC 29334]|uniref:SH3-like domain-containing protein n=1 Tax=Polymorphobacter sp. PAMC 29334 TaxID=2862331 RepID=UPI001C67826D|nr:SH3-like domain-containing protein [Polymorphobacter sp. PAMC 29334]QYE33312.1 nitrile hydratase subunit beta [Polymorphobacter sp. PAMC 29334]
MEKAKSPSSRYASGVVFALGEQPVFAVGDRVRIGTRSPIGHYRVPTYLRGKTGVVTAIITPVAVDNEEEGFGHDAGMKRHYYRLALIMSEVWSHYSFSSRDSLHVEVFENWLERVV